MPGNKITKVEMNGEDLSGNYKNYISKIKEENNVLKVTLLERFIEGDKILLSIDSGYSWINISNVFNPGDKCTKFKLNSLLNE